jgi:hypothetical protein
MNTGEQYSVKIGGTVIAIDSHPGSSLGGKAKRSDLLAPTIHGKITRVKRD